MSFLNKYNNDNNRYDDSTKVGDFIYSIGKIATNFGLITKTDLNGFIIWEKKYPFVTNIINYPFFKIVGCDNGNILAITTNYNDSDIGNATMSIARIDSEGNVIWCKLYPVPHPDAYSAAITQLRILKIGFESYFICMSRNVQVPSRGVSETVIFKIDQNGNILNQKVFDHIQNIYISIFGMNNSDSKILLYGYEETISGNSVTSSPGVIFEFDFNLNLIQKIKTDFYGVYGAFYSGNDIVILGNAIATNCFVARITPQSIQSLNINIKHFSDSSTTYRSLYFNNQFIYLKTNFGSNVVKLNYNFEVIWTKILNGVDINNYLDDYDFLIKEITDENVIVCYDNVIGLLNLDLDSCLTETLTTDVLLDGTATISLDLGASVSPITIQPSAVALNSSLLTSTSIREGVCRIKPTFTQIPPTCIGKTLSPLPKASLEGIEGTWSPALNNNESTIYTFTPNDISTSLTTSMTIEVTPAIKPKFNRVASIHSGAILNPLPTVSKEGIVGTWSPAIDNTKTTTYTFTPDPSACAEIATMTIVVNIISNNPCDTSGNFLNTYEIGNVGKSINNTNENQFFANAVKINNHVYAVGYTKYTNQEFESKSGLITKTDINGILIWENKYNFENLVLPTETEAKDFVSETGFGGFDNLEFRSVIQCENDDIIVLCVSETQKLIVLRVSPDGTLLWSNQYGNDLPSYYDSAFYVSKLAGENYVIFNCHAYNDAVDYYPVATYAQNNIIKIDAQGIIILQKEILGLYVNSSSSSLNVTSMVTNDDTIVLSGNQLNGFSYDQGTSFFTGGIVFDANLNEINRFGFELPGNFVRISTVQFLADELLILGSIAPYNNTGEHESFITKISSKIPQPTTGTLNIKILPSSNALGVGMVHNDKFIYYKYAIDGENRILKLNPTLELLWTKKFDYPDAIILDQASCAHVIFHSNNYPSLLALLNLDLDSCKTSVIPTAQIENRSLDFYPDFEINIYEGFITPVAVNLPFSNQYPIVEKVCPKNPCDSSSPFLNTYELVSPSKVSKSSYENEIFNNAVKINNHVYTVGYTQYNSEGTYTKGLIIKTDLKGAIVWENKYNFENLIVSDVEEESNPNTFESLEFRSVIACENDDVMILGVTDTKKIIVSRIDPEGTLLWSKDYDGYAQAQQNPTSYDTACYLSKLSGENYVLFIGYAYKDPAHSYPAATYTHSNIIKIDSLGNILIQNELFALSMTSSPAYSLNITGMASSDDQIVLSGNQLIDYDGNGTFFTGCIVFDANLIETNRFGFDLLGHYVRIRTVQFHAGELIILGAFAPYPTWDYTAFIAKTSSSTSPTTGSLDIKLLPSSNATGIGMVHNDDFIFYKYTIAGENRILKLNHDFDLIWTKKFDYTDDIILDQATCGYVVFHSDNYPALLGMLNLDFESCKTFVIPAAQIQDNSLNFYPYFEINIYESNVIALEVILETLYLYNIVNEVCPVIIGITPTFTQVGAICSGKVLDPLPTTSNNGITGTWSPAINNTTTTTYTFTPNSGQSASTTTMTIVVNPSVLPTFAPILPIYICDDLLPLPTTSLEGITGTWSPAVNNRKTTTYTFTPDDTGSCVLPTAMTIVVLPKVFDPTTTSESLIQSGFLYLQSAGSIGEDSTKGIHLRWILRDVLQAHLPKGNEAIPGINFNKNDDFVKIFRAPYKPTKVLLDLKTEIPTVVNDNAYFWIYSADKVKDYECKPNADPIAKRPIHLNFRDASRYNAARQSFDPSLNAFDFLKAYGNGLLEFETQTELFFAITPSFVITGNTASNVRLEILSVEENKTTAPKAALLRKTYVTSELNEAKLLNENSRSIRFTSNNATIEKLEFEFYSDFIKNGTNNNDWKALGDHALTLDTATAFGRLEPEPGILSDWLRYNNEAFVNVENYKTKWNDSSIEEQNRIKEVVATYIDLSNDVDNPFANEIVDPTDPEFKISNLKLLQIAALDYHIARMLGLGILDIENTVFDGQYIYAAKYITFGDLQDGKGARPVEHIYTSLPTAITDQRLPLPVDLKEPVPGMFYTLGVDIPEVLTDVNGYSHDGKTKYFTLYNEDLPDEILNPPFYYKPFEFAAAESTIPVYAGIEYRKSVSQGQPVLPWVKPELSYDRDYYNIDQTVAHELSNETRSIIIPEPSFPLFVHRERTNGFHDYSSYGINWFSRASNSAVVWTVESVIKPTNSLLPPTNVNAVLVTKESPLLLTTALEQVMYNAISQTDKTLVRLTFDYNHGQELIDYHKTINGKIVSGYQELPDNEELFAENIEIFFRNQIPNSVSGKVANVIPHGNPLLSIIETAPYDIISSGIKPNTNTVPPTYNDTRIPIIPNGLKDNFIGSVIVIDGKEFIIHEIDVSSVYPRFTVINRKINDQPINLSINTKASELVVPTPNGLFIIVENMLNEGSWSTPNPLTLKVNIDHTTIYKEEVVTTTPDGTANIHAQKFRGIYEDATIEKIEEEVDLDNDGIIDVATKHLGLYKITFTNYQLQQHSQFTQANNPVEWYNGIVRLHTLSPDGTIRQRKEFKVIRTENIAVPNAPLIIYIVDLAFPTDNKKLPGYDGKLMLDSEKSINQKVNYYPGYKVYLYTDVIHKIDALNILPPEGEDVKYTIFGLRSHDNPTDFHSKMSVPTLMFAKAIREPEQPDLPIGGKYATRPDFFGKATYTFTTKYKHKPHSVQFNRASDIQMLSAIFDDSNGSNEAGKPIVLSTVEKIMIEIFKEGNDDFYANRWENLLDFKEANVTKEFKKFPDPATGVALPFPDSPSFIKSINVFIDEHNNFYKNVPFKEENIKSITDLDATVIRAVNLPNGTIRNEKLRIRDFIKDIIHNCFVPLTEIPVIYDYVNGGNYKPIPKKQKVRDRNGNLLKNTDLDFDMAPMMKRIDANGSFESQFTDFGLDGASNAKYFYAVREINDQLKTSDYSPIIGPINLVNSAPPTAPEIIKVIPVLENRTLQVNPAIQLQINAYSKVQNIKKINIYRADNSIDSLSIRTMKLVKIIDIEVDGLADESKWIFTDDFSDLAYIPYADPLYYRITVSRIIKYNDKNGDTLIDYAPSEASKVVLTNIVENYSPESPVVKYASEPILSNGNVNYITFFWDENVYKGNYHMYKMNDQGNWVEIAQIYADRLIKGKYHIYNTDPAGKWLERTTLKSINGQIYLNQELTNLRTNQLKTKTTDGNTVYHHFKIIAENTSGMFSSKENILSIYNKDSWNDIGGIGVMIVGSTFIVRDDGLGRFAIGSTFEIQ
jgi:hypothetical protein